MSPSTRLSKRLPTRCSRWCFREPRAARNWSIRASRGSSGGERLGFLCRRISPARLAIGSALHKIVGRRYRTIGAQGQRNSLAVRKRRPFCDRLHNDVWASKEERSVGRRLCCMRERTHTCQGTQHVCVCIGYVCIDLSHRHDAFPSPFGSR